MGKLDALWEYQKAELEKEQLEREVLQTPSRAKFNKLHVFLTERQSAISRMQSEVAQKQAGMEKLQEQMEKLVKDIDLEQQEFEQMCKDEECTAAEITESRENHEKLLRELNALQRELSSLTSWMEKTLADYKVTRTEASKAKKEYDTLRLVCEQELKDSEEARKAADKTMADKAKAVDSQLMERYRRVKRNHTVPMAKVENKQCGGCNMGLPMVVIKRVQGSDSVVECDNCGRILYAGEEA